MSASPGRAALVAALLLTALAGARWSVVGGREWAAFAVPGVASTDPERLPFPATPGAEGYDGQFYLALAMDPWPEGPQVRGIILDQPAYRHQRILYPFAAWALSGGSERWAPVALVAVNGAALVGLVWVCGALAAGAGLSPMLGLTSLAVPGLLLAFGRDTAEPVVTFLAAAALLLLVRRRYAAMTAVLGLAVLAREDALLLSAAALGAAFHSRSTEGARIPYVVGLVPLGVFAAWQAALAGLWGEPPVLAAQGALSLPLVGLVCSLAIVTEQSLAESAVQLLYLAWHFALAGLVARVLWRGRGGTTTAGTGRWLVAVLGLWAALALSLSERVWVDEWAFARVLAQAAVLAGAALLLERRRPGRPFGRPFLAFTALVLALSAGRLVFRP